MPQLLFINEVIRRADSPNMGGLVGGYFQFAVGGQLYGITCRHVIAPEKCKTGDVIMGLDQREIGRLSHWMRLVTDTENAAEFALFKIAPSVTAYWLKSDPVFKPEGYAVPAIGDTADFSCDGWNRHGTVTDISHRVEMPFSGKKCKFKCIEVTSRGGEKFSEPGHSGGAVYIGKKLLGIILGTTHSGKKTYIVPYVDGILNIVDFKNYTF